MVAKNMKRFAALALGLWMVTTGVSMDTQAAVQKNGAKNTGSFAFAVFTQNETVVEPVHITYEAGDTLKDALLDSDYEFGGLETGFIYSVEGIAGNYSMVFADGGFGLDTAADQVGTLFLSERTDVTMDTAPELTKEVSVSLKMMADYRALENNVQNYQPAKSAYLDLLTYMRTGTEEILKGKREVLEEAILAYEAYLESDVRWVTVHVTQGGKEVEDAKLTFTDEYGNVTEGSGTEIQLRDGIYSYVISDCHAPYNYTTNVGKMNKEMTSGEWNMIENYITVGEGSTAISAKLPSGEWFGQITAEANASKALYEEKTVYDQKAHKIIFYVADSFSGSVKPTIQKSEGTPEYETQGTLSSVPIYPWIDYIYGSGVNAGKWVSDVAVTSNTNKASFASAKSCLNFLAKGMEENSMKLDIRWLDDREADATGNMVVQSYTAEVKRVPTLVSLEVRNQVGSSVLPGFDPFKNSYDITTTDDRFTVDAAAYGQDYQIALKAGNHTEVNDRTVILNGSSGSFTVEVTKGAHCNIYTVNLTKVSAVEVTLTMDLGVTAEVLNANGSKIEPKTAGGTTYALVPGAVYSYQATLEEHYHTTAEFTASAGLRVAVAKPEVKQVLTGFATYDNSSSKNRKAHVWDQAFSSDRHQYQIQVSDANTVLYVQADKSDASYTYYTKYLQQTTMALYGDQLRDWTEQKISYPVSTEKNAQILPRLVTKSGQSNVLGLQLRKVSQGILYYQEYTFSLVRSLHLSELAVSAESVGALKFEDQEGNALAFHRDTLDYFVKISADTPKLHLAMAFQNEEDTYSFDGGYYAMINDVRYDDVKSVDYELDVQAAEERIEIKICHKDPEAVSNVYTVTVKKQQPVRVTFQTTPKEATVFVTNELDKKPVYAEEGGKFLFMPEISYTYIVSAPGYRAVEVTGYQLTEKDQQITLPIELEKAPEPEHALPDYEAQWPTFRADFNGNGVVSAKTPTTAEDTVLYWANKIGEGLDSNASGCPILVNGYLYTYAGDQILKVDTISGEVLARGNMLKKSSFAINSPTYADGMIFVGLSGGSVQAFHAETLESLWIYTDPLGGQPNCSIKYQDGYLYTGFWNGETKQANFVCLSATDEDPSRTDEEKLASWRYTHHGFYWAGAYACENFVLVGTDDGASGYTTGHSSVLSFDPKTGKLLDEKVLPGVGDLRSDIMYDEAGTGDYYFTTKGGDFYRLSVNENGIFQNLKQLKLYNYADDRSNPAMSTCTPVVYNGRAYIGVSGTGQFSAYSGHNITVIDLASWSIAYTVRTQGYPQTSGLLTTAYEEETGLVYVYFIDNYTPGKIRVISDRKGQTKPNEVSEEAGYEVAPVLFTPSGNQAQYAICSPISDADGFLYFKNDSANMMCIGPKLEKLEVTRLPDQILYRTGEVFRADGMKVMATYSNGAVREVTDYVTYSEEALTAEDTELIVEFPYVMYQDKNGETGVEYTAPTARIELIVGEAEKPAPEEKPNPDETPDTKPEEKDPVTEAFTDVVADSWYVDAVQYVYNTGLMSGFRDQFTPNANMSRAMVVTTLYRMEGSPAVTDYSAYLAFKDVKEGDWYADAVAWALNNDIATGDPINQKFNPNANVTREQLAAFLYRYTEFKGGSVTERGDFSDMKNADKVSNWALKEMQWAVGTELISGIVEVKGEQIVARDLAPQGNATRAQMATILQRYCEQ